MVDNTDNQVVAKQTLRPVVENLEEILYKQIPALDRGFIRVIDYMGDDGAIVQAARVSYGKGTKAVKKDEGLIKYLMRHNHTSPFEMCEIKLHVKMPIFVARQWLRHRTANINEYSARYSILDNEFYIPEHQYIAAQSIQNKQGRGDSALAEKEAARILHILKEDSALCYEHYCEMLNQNQSTGEIIDSSKNGVAREIARMNLTLNCYTQIYWKIDLNNLLHFLKLRSSPHAQFEIRIYANIILDIVKRWVPYVFSAFIDYKLNSYQISAQGIIIIREILAGKKVLKEQYDISISEWNELMRIFHLEERKNSINTE